MVYSQDWQIERELSALKRIHSFSQNDSTSKESFVIRSTSIHWNQVLNTDTIKKKPSIRFLFIGQELQHNNHLPIGFNDGNFIPNVGLQQKLSLGVRFNWGPLQIHLQPERISAQNLPGISFQDNIYDTNYRRNFYWYIRNKVDNGNRIGSEKIEKIFAGQSSIRLNTKSLSLGISTENIWWGPGLRNSLLLTNNAAGFLHLAFNTIKPIKTPLGNVEFQTILGNLDSAIAPSIDFENNALSQSYIEPKSKNKRSLVGYYLSLQPKWFKNFYLGLGGVSYFYKSSPTITVSNNLLFSENKIQTGRLSSIFMRYAIPKENAEIYFEYGRNGRFFAPFHIIGDTIPTGYIVGFRKQFPILGHKPNTPQATIVFGVELTQLQLPDNRLIFNSGNVRGIPRTNSWYTHPYIKQGYTNQGQVLGASIGPGSNSQTVHVSWIKGLKKIGISVERILNNSDFYQYHYFKMGIGNNSPSSYWVDINVGAEIQWNFKRWILNGKYLYTSALNYRWTKLDGGFARPSTLSDKTNQKISFSLFYSVF